jgi:hypothetical protein
MPSKRIDFSDWARFSNAISTLNRNFPELMSLFLRNTVSRYRDRIQIMQLTQGIRVTGTYENSIGIEETGTSRNPEISIVINPVGPESDRLPIYWKVLEFGSAPNHNVPVGRLIQWANTKFNNPGAGWMVAQSIKERGTRPHPILSSIFQLSRPDGEIIGITGLAELIADEEAQKILDNMTNIVATRNKLGKLQFRIPKGQPGAGRFTKL